MHAVILKATGGDDGPGPGRVLWRVDRDTTTALYLLSHTEPDCTQIVSEAGTVGVAAHTLDYSPFLARLQVSQVWAFRLAANPSRAVSQGPGLRGKRQGHVTVEQQRSWLLNRAESLGVELLPIGDEGAEGSSLVVTRRARPVFGRDNPDRGRRDRVTINQTVYEGVFQVTDPDALRHCLVAGIGRSKAYGCGLMTLARVRRG